MRIIQSLEVSAHPLCERLFRYRGLQIGTVITALHAEATFALRALDRDWCSRPDFKTT